MQESAASASTPPIAQAQYQPQEIDEWARRGIVRTYSYENGRMELRCTRDAELPAGLGGLEELKSLIIDAAGFRIGLPSDVFSGHNLEEVSLWHFAKLDSLPIEEGKRLDLLHFKDCQLRGLPKGLEKLARIRSLSIEGGEILRRAEQHDSVPGFLRKAIFQNGHPLLDCDDLFGAPKQTLRDYLVFQQVRALEEDLDFEINSKRISRRLHGILETVGTASARRIPFGCRLAMQSSCDESNDSLWIHPEGGVLYGSNPWIEWRLGKEISLAEGKIREGASVSEVEAVMGRPKRRGAGFLFYSVTQGETETESSTESHLFLFRKGRLWGVLRSSSSVEC